MQKNVLFARVAFPSFLLGGVTVSEISSAIDRIIIKYFSLTSHDKSQDILLRIRREGGIVDEFLILPIIALCK